MDRVEEETVVYFCNLLLTRVYIEEMIYVLIENGLYLRVAACGWVGVCLVCE